MRAARDAATITYGPDSEKAVLAYDGGRPRPMVLLQRLVSLVLLMAGVALVFVGLTRSLGLTPAAALASAAAIAALLYTGGVWFGSPLWKSSIPPSDATAGPMLFDLRGRLIGGPAAGQPVASLFPDTLRLDLERHCTAALAGKPARFPCMRDGRSVVFDVLPVLGADRTVCYGLILPSVAAEAETAIAAVVV